MTPQLSSLLNQSISALQSNDDQSAEHCLKQAIQLAPKDPDALHLLGIIEAKRRNLESALAYFQRALKVAPHNAFINNNLGNVLLEANRINEALVAFDKAISIDPNYAQAYCNKGNALQRLRRYDDALMAFDKAILTDPNDVQAYCDKGSTLQEMQRLGEAILVFDKALVLNPYCHQAYNNTGSAYYELMQYEEAIVACDQAIALDPNSAQVYFNKSLALQALKRYREALENIHKAIQIKADYADAHFAAAVLHLRLGEFKSGWAEWDWRWLASNSDPDKFVTDKPLWDGKKTHQRILIWPEQGIGDQILYGSMFKEVGLLTPKLTVVLESRLLAIFRRSFPDLHFVDKRIAIPPEEYDLQVSMGSLMKFLRPDVNSFSKANFPYLAADKAKIASLKSSSEWAQFSKVVCGISWKSFNAVVGKHRSIPLDKLSPLLNIDRYEFVNLQHGNIKSDLRILEDECAKKIHHIPNIDLFHDLDGILALICACDLIVTCDNTVAHMAGSLNKQTILMVPFEIGKYWYWNDFNGQTLFYPSIKIFSQPRQGDWDEVIKQIKVYMESLSLDC